METLTVCDPPSTLGWVLMAKCFASKLPERIIPKRQRSVCVCVCVCVCVRGCVCERTGQMAGVCPHPPSLLADGPRAQAGLLPPDGPHPQELLPLKRVWNEGSMAQSSPKSSLKGAGQNRHSPPLTPSTPASCKVIQAQPEGRALDCPS